MSVSVAAAERRFALEGFFLLHAEEVERLVFYAGLALILSFLPTKPGRNRLR